MAQLHTYRVRNLSGTFNAEIQADNSASACMLAFERHGVHRRSKLIVKMVYDKQEIARELDEMAQGIAHHGNALRVAKDIPGLDADDRALLDRFATGLDAGMDHVRLQDLAIKIRVI